MPSQQVRTEHVFPRSLDRQRATLRCAQIIIGQEVRRLQQRQRYQCRQSASAVPCRFRPVFMDFGGRLKRSGAAIEPKQIKGVPNASKTMQLTSSSDVTGRLFVAREKARHRTECPQCHVK
jgi:hypothetical protein